MDLLNSPAIAGRHKRNARKGARFQNATFDRRRVNPLPTLPLIVLLIWGLFIGCAVAEDTTNTFFTPLKQRLIADGFDAQRVQALYQHRKVAFESKTISAYFLHSEAKIDYKKMTISPWIVEGRHYMREHEPALRRAEERFGVDPKVITAIILVETKFGRNLGKQSILNILSTMAALNENEPREHLWTQLPADRRFSREQYNKKADQKSTWAYKELKAFLTYTEQHQLDPVSIVGSYAGAMGIAQFMPTSVLAYGQDGNDDGRINLFEDADAIHSIANYLKVYGWRPGIDREQAYKAIYQYNRSSYYVNTILEITDMLKE
jgi:membrane-bound lytic murein transglycosylase B